MVLKIQNLHLGSGSPIHIFCIVPTLGGRHTRKPPSENSETGTPGQKRCRRQRLSPCRHYCWGRRWRGRSSPVPGLRSDSPACISGGSSWRPSRPLPAWTWRTTRRRRLERRCNLERCKVRMYRDTVVSVKPADKANFGFKSHFMVLYFGLRTNFFSRNHVFGSVSALPIYVFVLTLGSWQVSRTADPLGRPPRFPLAFHFHCRECRGRRWDIFRPSTFWMTVPNQWCQTGRRPVPDLPGTPLTIKKFKLILSVNLFNQCFPYIVTLLANG